MIVTFKDDKHQRERYFPAAAETRRPTVQREWRPGPPDRLSFVNAVCVCLCLQTETNHRVFSYSCCAHFLAQIRSPASVCHVRGEAGGDRSGGRTMKMSFIQAGREGERKRWNQNRSGILKQRKKALWHQEDLLKLFLAGRHGDMMRVVLEMCEKRVFLTGSVGEALHPSQQRVLVRQQPTAPSSLSAQG